MWRFPANLFPVFANTTSLRSDGSLLFAADSSFDSGIFWPSGTPSLRWSLPLLWENVSCIHLPFAIFISSVGSNRIFYIYLLLSRRLYFRVCLRVKTRSPLWTVAPLVSLSAGIELPSSKNHTPTMSSPYVSGLPSGPTSPKGFAFSIPGIIIEGASTGLET